VPLLGGGVDKICLYDANTEAECDLAAERTRFMCSGWNRAAGTNPLRLSIRDGPLCTSPQRDMCVGTATDSGLDGRFCKYTATCTGPNGEAHAQCTAALAAASDLVCKSPKSSIADARCRTKVRTSPSGCDATDFVGTGPCCTDATADDTADATDGFTNRNGITQLYHQKDIHWEIICFIFTLYHPLSSL
jgi:hypothetical protein